LSCPDQCPVLHFLDVAEAIAPGCRIEYIGIRPGEKLHEEMITETDAFYSIELGNGKYYAILPASPDEERKKYLLH
jgi:FlaA1/EpsC-like NDP-sugar epimerase